MSILSREKVKLNAQAKDKFEAIRIAGQLLVDAGHADRKYIDKMIEREQELSTYMGCGLAIPHGTGDSKGLINSTGMSIVRLAEGVDFGEGELTYLLVGIASSGDDHLGILTNVATVCADDDNLESILKADTADEIIAIFSNGDES
jgi:PTS system mannitol-specific IIA component